MTVESQDAAPGRLAWRIPTTQERSALFLARVRWFLTLVVFSLVIAFAWPAETRWHVFAAATPLFAFAWWWMVIRRQRGAGREPNIWLDSLGLHWLDAGNRQQSLSREQACSFTVRETPYGSELQLVLDEGFLSQPLLPHPPVTLEDLCQHLSQAWKLAKEPWSEERDQGDRLATLCIASQIDNGERSWDLEGTADELASFADALDLAAQTHLPPVGACPRAQHVWLTRTEDHALLILVDEVVFLSADSLSAPPERLRELAAQLRQELTNRGGESEWSFDWPTDDGKWTIALHVLPAP